MITLPDILKGLYADKTEKDVHLLIENHKLIEPLKRTVSQLNNLIANEKIILQQCGCLPIGHVASNLLWSINQFIGKEIDRDIKLELENIYGDICSSILKKFLSDIRSDKQKITRQINYAIKDSCEFYNFDFNQVLRLLKLSSEIPYLQSLQSGEHLKSYGITYYIWRGKPKDFKDFLKLFSERKLVTSRKNLHFLFQQPTAPLDLRFDPEKANLILQLFSNLKQKKLLAHCKCNGFYRVLTRHIPDFEQRFLKNKAPGARLNTLKQNRTQWNDNQRKIDKWLAPFLAH